MTLIKTDKGLNIPIAGDPYGPVQDISSQSSGITVQTISLDLSPFEDIRFKILKKQKF